MLEPTRRDSGPAIAAGAALARLRDPDAVVLALAADHVIEDVDLFQSACLAAREAAAAGYIVTFGIRPAAPKTGYGYIRPGAPLSFATVHTVDAFVEKPQRETAIRYVADGYLWNSGNFIFRADTLLAELAKFAPGIAEAAEESVEKAQVDLDFLRLDRAAFAASPQKSIDYAVMEHTDRAAVVEGTFRWSDIGSWDAVHEISRHDQDGNAVRGAAFTLDSTGCVVQADGMLTAVVGVKDLVVISTVDATLVVPRARAEEVKNLVAQLKELRRNEVTDHRRCDRPWGYYESVDKGERFQVKRIVVTPGGKLSLQRHMHRSEHWIVVRGAAEVTSGESVRIVHENESIYIPIGTIHRLANPGKIPLELIEVQTGSYLGEDDIVRLEDVYQRG